MSQPLVVLVTVGSEQEAEEIAESLVRSLLAAAVNVVPGVASIYRWAGVIQHEQEWLLIAKTRRDVLDELVECVLELHSYDVPGIVALPLVGGNEAYLRWLDRSVESSWHDVD